MNKFNIPVVIDKVSNRRKYNNINNNHIEHFINDTNSKTYVIKIYRRFNNNYQYCGINLRYLK
jgi:hypothetical protein